MSVALGATPLCAHDLHALNFLTHFMRSPALPSMLNELRVAPSGHYDVPVERWSEPVPPSMARLFSATGESAPDAVTLDETPLADAMTLVRLKAAVNERSIGLK